MTAASSAPRAGAGVHGPGAGDPAGGLLALVAAVHAPESSDSEFTWDNFQTSVNKDLADVLGNFVSRITKFCRSKFGEAVPEGGSYGAQEQAVIDELATRIRAYEGHMEAMEVRKSAQELRAIWVAGNEYLQSAAPWATFKEDPEQAAAQVRLGLNLIRLYAVLSAPFIPFAAAQMLTAMGVEDAQWPGDVAEALSALPAGHVFTVPTTCSARSPTMSAQTGRNASPASAARRPPVWPRKTGRATARPVFIRRFNALQSMIGSDSGPWNEGDCSSVVPPRAARAWWPISEQAVKSPFAHCALRAYQASA